MNTKILAILGCTILVSCGKNESNDEKIWFKAMVCINRNTNCGYFFALDTNKDGMSDINVSPVNLPLELQHDSIKCQESYITYKLLPDKLNCNSLGAAVGSGSYSYNKIEILEIKK